MLVNVGIAQVILSSLNAFTDILILILPIPTIRKLQLPRSRKSTCGQQASTSLELDSQVLTLNLVGLLVVYSAGFISFAATIAGLVENVLYDLSSLNYFSSARAQVPQSIVAQVEVCTALICCCVPAMACLLRPIISRGNSAASAFRTFLSYSSRSKTTTSDTTPAAGKKQCSTCGAARSWSQDLSDIEALKMGSTKEARSITNACCTYDTRSTT